jgi:hypothetical protein
VIQSGSQLRLSEDGIHLGDVVVVWAPAPGPGCYWVQYPGDRRAFKVRVTSLRVAPHPIVQITEDQ